MNRKNAFAYDFLAVPGGAERLALHVMGANEHFDLVTGYVDHAAFGNEELPVGRVRALTSTTGIRGWHAIKSFAAFHGREAFLQNYQTVVFSGFYAPEAVRHRSGMRNLYYCHTPPRFAYDFKDWFLSQAPATQRPLMYALVALVRSRYEKALQQMDRIAANSENVSRRLQRYLGIENAVVIHPPVDTEAYRWLGQDGYYLSTARLEPYKRVDLVVRAFMQMPDRKLVVASGGSQLDSLQRLAAGHDNIRFTGWQTAAQMRDLVGRCIATVYLPIDEDFGMSPVESMAAGKPVIGVAEGGLLETVLAEKTGRRVDQRELVDPDSAATAIRKAVDWLSTVQAKAMGTACESAASRFDAAVFDDRFRKFFSE